MGLQKPDNWRTTTEEAVVELLDLQRRDTDAVRAHFRRNARGLSGLPVKSLPGARIDCVYYIAACGRIKIGKSENVQKRLAEIQTPEAPELLGIEPGYSEVEAERHREFGHLRVYGEWFMPGPELMAQVIKVRGLGRWWARVKPRTLPKRIYGNFDHFERQPPKPPWLEPVTPVGVALSEATKTAIEKLTAGDR